MAQHAAPRSASHPRRGRRWLLVALAVVVVLLGAGGGAAVYYSYSHNSDNSASASPKPAVTPLNLLATTPAAGATNVASDTAITVDLSAPLAADTPLPTLTPPVAGTWQALSPTELEFSAAGPLVPGSQETLTVPGGSSGLVSTQNQYLAATVTAGFTVAQGSMLRLQQLLAQLGYLPVAFTPTTQPTSPQQLADVQEGAFSWRWANVPSQLTALWTEGTTNVITRGAIMDFEDQHGLTTDGLAGPQVWSDLLAAATTGAVDPNQYDYVFVNQSLPETATVYRNGTVAFETRVNTGVTGATTADGTFPVFLRYTVTTMTGTNPDGTKYSDPGIKWVSYFNGGDALHGFVRASYGWPQSDGCVEMPVANAAVVWPMTPVGTLVTVV
jgi:peptidoglycan hydrolase-like protein with peptidoglycan-binding domain